MQGPDGIDLSGIDVEERRLAVPRGRRPRSTERALARPGGSTDLDIHERDVMGKAPTIIEVDAEVVSVRALPDGSGTETLDDVLGRPKTKVGGGGDGAAPPPNGTATPAAEAPDPKRRRKGHDAEGANVELPEMPEPQDDLPDRWSAAAWGTVEEWERKARTRWTVPQDAEFRDDAGAFSGAIVAHDLTRLGMRLIGEVPRFASLATIQIRYYWRRKGGSVLAHAKKPDVLHEADGAGDIEVWFAADNLRAMYASELEVEALMFDCLYSIDPSKPGVNRPEFSGNLGTVLRYGWGLLPELRLVERVLLKPHAPPSGDGQGASE